MRVNYFLGLAVVSTLMGVEQGFAQGTVEQAKDDQVVSEASQKNEMAPQDEAGCFYLSAGVGGLRAHGMHSATRGGTLRKVSPYVTLRLGYDFAESPWSVEGGALFGSTSKTNGDGFMVGGFGDVLWHFDRYARFDPFLAAGVGVFGGNHSPIWQDGHAINPFVDVGLGAMYHFDENWSMRADARYHVGIDNEFMSFTTVDVGLSYAFGGNEPATAETLAPLGPIEAGAQAYDEASDFAPIIKDVTPVGSQDAMHLELHVVFEKDTSIIDPSNYEALDELGRMIRVAIEANPEVYVTLDGHADRQHGSDHAYNQRLSEDRAKSIKTYLVAYGISAGKLKAAGHSFDQPKYPVDLENGTPNNRRTDAVIRGVDEATRAKMREGLSNGK